MDESLGGGWDALHSGRADIAVGVSKDLPKGEYQLTKIGEIEFVFAIAAGHPLANLSTAGSIISNETLLEYPSIVVADTSYLSLINPSLVSVICLIYSFSVAGIHQLRR
ncbi:hypothetical protein MK852_15845 [Shewanella benthica]|nr:hypothetical protein [Shewanella benthica]MBE7215892.1 hypothetical protein [Shewanella benthica]MCL1063584.1 hypothetical protein [Shewanella benthica]